MKAEGNVRKMKTELGDVVQYQLQLGDTLLNMNELIGNNVNLVFTGKINCISCGRTTKRSFAQGFCYSCFLNAPENSDCIIRPELCQGHLGKGRDVEWEEQNHVQPHVVYLALSSHLKVGVTRAQQIPTRWIDQGAWKALVLAEVPYRKLAGEIEIALKAHLSDKTSWQAMLKNTVALDIDLLREKSLAANFLPEQLKQYMSNNQEITQINYPVQAYPQKVKSYNLDKWPIITNKLKGIKGQYLIFDGGMVINLRKYSGYYISIDA